MEKVLKISLILILTISIFWGIFQTNIYAADGSYSGQMSQLLKDSETYTDKTKTVDKVNTITSTVITSIRVIGVAVAIVMLLTLAMKYMTAAPGDKADIKKSAIQYVVGAIVLFGVVGILGIISNFSSAIK